MRISSGSGDKFSAVKNFMNWLRQTNKTSRRNNRKSSFPNTAAITSEELESRQMLTTILSISDTTASESAGTMEFEVTLSEPVDEIVAVEFSTQDGTAIAGSNPGEGDYDAIVDRLITFDVGETSKIVAVMLNNDREVEPDESFGFHFSNLESGESNVRLANPLSSGDPTFFSVNADTDELVKIDHLTGEVTVVGLIGHDMKFTKMAFLDGLLYAVTTPSDDPFSFPDWDLIAIDPSTGKKIYETSITINEEKPAIIEGITSRNDELIITFGIVDRTSSNLGTLHPKTGDIDLIFDIDKIVPGNKDFDGMTSRPDGTLIVVDVIGYSGSTKQVAFYELQEDPLGIKFLGDFLEPDVSTPQLTTDGVAIYYLDSGRNEITIHDPMSPRDRLFTAALDDSASQFFGLAADFVVGTPFPKGTITNDDTPFHLESVSPQPNSQSTQIDTNIATSFDTNISPESIDAKSFVVRSGYKGQLQDDESVFSIVDGQVTLDPNHEFLPGELVEVTLTQGIESATGQLDEPFVFQFRAEAGSGGTGFFHDIGQRNYRPGSSSMSAKLGDLDADGDLDLFVVGRGEMYVYFNDGNGIFQDSGQRLFRPNANQSAEEIAFGDIDGDGDLDAVTAMNGSASFVWINDGNGFFTDSGQDLFSQEGSRNSSVALGDLDGDGDLDAYIGSRLGYSDFVFLNNGEGEFTEKYEIELLHTTDVSLGDLDGDGDLDAFVTQDFDASNRHVPNRVLLNVAGILTLTDQEMGLDVSTHLELGDLDLDGDLDAFVTNHTAADQIWFNDGAGFFIVGGQQLQRSTTNVTTNSVSLGDLDGDGDLDAFTISRFQELNTVWFNDGTGKMIDDGQVMTRMNTTSDIVLGDLDGDGDLDAFLIGSSGNTEVPWFNQNRFLDKTFITGPASVISDRTPVITWIDLSRYIAYEILIYDFPIGRLAISTFVGSNSFYHPTVPWHESEFQIFVRGINIDGFGPGPWSDPHHFVISSDTPGSSETPVAPTLTGPKRIIEDHNPIITWAEFPGAVRYDLLVYSTTLGREIVHANNVSTTYFEVIDDLPVDSYQAFVRAKLGNGEFTNYGGELLFDIEENETRLYAPKFITRKFPLSFDPAPTFGWFHVKDAVDYELHIYDVDAGQLVESTTTTNGNHFYAIQNSLDNRTYRLYIRAKSSQGEFSEWSKFQFRNLFVNSVSQIDSEFPIESNIEMLPELPVLESGRANFTDETTELENLSNLDSIWNEWPQFDWWDESSMDLLANPVADELLTEHAESTNQLTFAEKSTAAFLGIGAAVLLSERKKKNAFLPRQLP